MFSKTNLCWIGTEIQRKMDAVPMLLLKQPGVVTALRIKAGETMKLAVQSNALEASVPQNRVEVVAGTVAVVVVTMRLQVVELVWLKY